MTLGNIVSKQILSLRRLERLLNRDDVQDLWEQTSPQIRLELINALNNFDYASVFKWIHGARDLEEQSLRELKRQARRIGILNWSRKSKEVLIEELRNGEADLSRNKTFKSEGSI